MPHLSTSPSSRDLLLGDLRQRWCPCALLLSCSRRRGTWTLPGEIQTSSSLSPFCKYSVGVEKLNLALPYGLTLIPSVIASTEHPEQTWLWKSPISKFRLKKPTTVSMACTCSRLGLPMAVSFQQKGLWDLSVHGAIVTAVKDGSPFRFSAPSPKTLLNAPALSLCPSFRPCVISPGHQGVGVLCLETSSCLIDRSLSFCIHWNL